MARNPKLKVEFELTAKQKKILGYVLLREKVPAAEVCRRLLVNYLNILRDAAMTGVLPRVSAVILSVQRRASGSSPYACRGRGLCPSCGQKRALAWAERMVEEVLPIVPYRQIVFTIPRNLRKAFLFDRSLYGGLCRVAYASTRDFLRSQASLLTHREKAVPAMIVSPQSFGDILVHHPHGHACVSLGLFRPDGVFLPMDDVDFSGLEESSGSGSSG